VIRTRVGYAGGTKKNPTYYSLGDHSETIQIDYDPAKIPYEQLLNIFWSSHHPDTKSWSRQYMAAVFYHNEEQKRLAIKTRDLMAEKLKAKIYTEILPATDFYLAEDYHQKYYLRQVSELIKEYKALYPSTSELIASTAVARVNGCVGGYCTFEQLKSELNGLGLSPAGSKRLSEIVCALDKRTQHYAKSGAYCPLPPTW
jgi:peptide-methionine (S)-S-oxide reductase